MIDFPSSPTIGQQYTSGSSTWNWNGSAWILVPVGVSANEILPTQTGNSGKVLSTDGTNTSWQAPVTPELVWITGQTITNLSNTVFLGCFSSTYRDYQIRISSLSINYIGKWVLMFMSGAGLYNSAVYHNAGWMNSATYNSTYSFAMVGGSRYYVATAGYTATNGVSEVNIYRPQLATNTEWMARSSMYSNYGSQEAGFFGGRYNGTVQFDGFFFQSETGQPFSARIDVYGCKNH